MFLVTQLLFWKLYGIWHIAHAIFSIERNISKWNTSWSVFIFHHIVFFFYDERIDNRKLTEKHLSWFWLKSVRSWISFYLFHLISHWFSFPTNSYRATFWNCVIISKWLAIPIEKVDLNKNYFQNSNWMLHKMC